MCSSSGATKLGYEMGWLTLSDGTRGRASPEVARNFDDHIKSAVHLTRVWDHREPHEGGVGRPGTACRLATQLSGLTPDENRMQFVQGRIDCQYARALSDSVLLTVDSATGVQGPMRIYVFEANEPGWLRYCSVLRFLHLPHKRERQMQKCKPLCRNCGANHGLSQEQPRSCDS